MTNNTPPEVKTRPTLAQIYEKTYCDELDKQFPEMKARILSAKDSNKHDRLVDEWVAGVTSKAELTYDILTTVPVPQDKVEADVPSEKQTAPMK